MAFEEYALVAAVLSLLVAGYFSWRITQAGTGTERMREISRFIRQGAMAFLGKEYRYLAVFVSVVAVVLSFIDIRTAGAFLLGALFSAAAGNVGMRIATAANVRTAAVAEKEIGKGLNIAFRSGGVMGLTVVGLGLLGVSVLFFVVPVPEVIFGFGFGASSIALFARVGGGIFTKAADIGADLVGKIEEGIPEDDPRNPGVIADNVGDNVGDVAGMGADLFESYVGSLIAAMAIGLTSTALFAQAAVLPLLIASLGIIASILGFFVVRGSTGKSIHGAMNRGIYFSSILTAIGSYLIIQYFGIPLNYFWTVLTGILSGLVIGGATEYYTSSDRKPVIGVANESKQGPATNIIAGLALGMESTVVPVLTVAAAIVLSFSFGSVLPGGGIYGIALAAVGLLSTLGITLAADCYGPVADNAAGIAEMAGLGKKARENCEALDAVGNTTAAIGKGFAIGSAGLTSLALFSVFASSANLNVISLTSPHVVAGLFVGAVLPFLFSALTMRSVGNTASQMIEEIRRQFREKRILQGGDRPDYARCVAISTGAALREMILPGLIAIFVPLLVGYFWSLEALGGLLAGSISSGFVLAVFMANAGGAWDNAKKYVEEGNLGGKGSAVHNATIVGDTVGDPFKDTSGPALNILIKLVNIVALVFLPILLAGV